MLNATFNNNPVILYIVVVSFIGGGNRSTKKKQKKHRPVVGHWPTLPHKVLSGRPRL